MITKRIPKNTTEKWAWIEFQLKRRGESFATIARELNVTRPAIYKVKNDRSARVEDAIAKKIGRLPVDLWPERYLA